MPISGGDVSQREYRLQRLTERLPAAARPAADWLRSPSARPVRLPAGLLLCLGGTLGALPLLGFWMLPVGIVLLAEDVPPLRRATDRMLALLEQRRPHWFAPASTAAIGFSIGVETINQLAARRRAGNDRGRGARHPSFDNARRLS